MDATNDVIEHLKSLVGLNLGYAPRAADMRMFQFGKLTDHESKLTGEYALHVQCPWRIEGPDGKIITGRSDLWDPVDESVDVSTWQYDTSENVQDKNIKSLLGRLREQHGLNSNAAAPLEVESVESSECGDATIRLTGGYKLKLFVSGSRGEAWRIFRPGSDDSHFVVGEDR